MYRRSVLSSMPGSMDGFDDGVFRRRSSWQYRELPSQSQDDADERMSYKGRENHTKPPLDADFYLSNDENLNTARLKHASTVSALLAGFSMEAYVQMELDDGLPSELMILFAVSSTSLIAVNLFALLCSVSLLPTINAYNIVSSRRAKEGQPQMPPQLSPHKRFKRYIVTAWVASVVLGIQLFLFQVIVVTWVHFYIKCKMAAVCVTATIAPAMILFAIFATHIQTGVLDLQMAPMQKALDYGLEENLHHQGASFDGLSRANSNLVAPRRTTTMSGLGLAGSVDPIQATSPGPRSPNAAIDSISDEFMEFYDADEHHPTLAKSANEKSYFGNKGSPSPAPLYASNRYYQHITHQPYPLLGVPSSQSFDQPSPHPGVTRVGRLGSLTEGTGLERYGASLDGSVRNSSRDVATGGNAEPLAREEVLPNDGLDGNRLLTKASSVTELMSAPQSTTSTNHSNNDHVNRCEREHRSGTGDRPSQEADSLHSTHRQSAVRMHSDGVCRDSDGYKGPGGAGNSRGGVNVRDSGLKSLLSTISNQTTASMERMLSSNSSTNSTHSFSNTAKTHNQVSGDRDTDYPIDDDHLDNNNNNTNNTKQSSTSSHGNSRSGRGRNVRTTESTTHVSSPSRHRRDRPRLCLSPGEPED